MDTAPAVDDELGLPHEARCHGRGKKRGRGRVENARRSEEPHAEQRDDGERAALQRVPGGKRDAPHGEAEQQEQDRKQRDETEHDRADEPDGRNLGKHGRHVRQVARVPEKVDGPPV
jgi:hypothetical protein